MNHTCHWPGCSAEVPPAMWGCRSHWFRLPKALRDRIWDTYREGQEIRKDPSPEYLAAAEAVQAWIRANCADEIGRPMVKALSILQPWAWLIVQGHKDIENRRWGTRYRGALVIHAGKKFGREQREDVAAVREQFPEIQMPEEFELGGIVGRAVIAGCVTSHPSPWFYGPWGLLLRDQQVLPFREWKGQLGLFDVPEFSA